MTADHRGCLTAEISDLLKPFKSDLDYASVERVLCSHQNIALLLVFLEIF